jgi:phage I-like protein
VLKVTMGALTNNPAIHGMQALNAMQAAASAQFSTPPSHPTEDPMNPLLKALLAALGLPETTTEQAALTAVQAHKDTAEAARTALALKAEDGATAVTAACSALTTKAPDPAKFVPVETVTAMQTQLAALTAQQQADQVDKLIQPALADGRLMPPWSLGRVIWARKTWPR